MSLNNWKVYCATEDTWVETTSLTEPTECPNNSGHTIRSVRPISLLNFSQQDTTSSSDNIDIGFCAKYIDSGVTKYSGLFRDASDGGTFKFYENLEEQPLGTVNTSGTGYILGDLDIGNLDINGNIVISGTVDGRDIAGDGSTQDSHIADATLHFTEGSIDHTAITNIGTNTHAQIDTHIASTSNPHSVEISDVSQLTTKGDLAVYTTVDTRLAIGSNDQALIADSGEASGMKWAIIDHTTLSNIGSNTHAQIDTHIASTSNPHSVDIDDVTPTTTKGDIIVENGSNAVRLAVGTNTQILRANSSEATGLEWVDNDSLCTASNVGSGSGLYKQKVGDDLELKTLIGGSNISLTANSNDITFNLDNTISLSGDLTVDGNLTVSGTTTTLNTENVTIEDPLFKLATNNQTDSVDLGFYSLYVDTGVTKFSGLFRDASDSTYKLYTGLQEEPTTTVNTSGTGYTLADLDIANLDVSGNVVVSGTVDGRDVAADGSAQDSHIASTSNPHSVEISDVSQLTTKGDLAVYTTVDTRLAVGSNNQALIADSGEASGMKWATIDHTTLSNIGSNTHSQIDSHISSTSNPHSVDIDDVTPTTTKGDIIVENGSNAIRLAIGSDGYVLTADPAEASGVKWAELPTESGQANTASNIGTAGVGMFKQKVGVDLEFKKLNAGSSKVTITDDTGNNEVDVDIVEANILHQSLSGAGTNTHAQIDTHIADTNNPHSVTIDQTTPTTTKGDLIVENGSNAIRLAVGSNQQILTVDSTESSGVKWTSFEIIKIVDEKNSGTDGGTFTSGAWQKRDLNTLTQSGSSASLASDEFTLTAGLYSIEVTTPASEVDEHQCRLYNVTDTSVEAYGSSSYADKDDIGIWNTHSFAKTYVNYSTTKTFRVEHRCSQTNDDDGYGLGAGFGNVEIFTTVFITKYP